ncbi:MAG: hypothetical protein Q4D73_05055 [Actinomycetaceae bacterium]|nr:hypothetical protein [Actinomycetaceae bacterium]
MAEELTFEPSWVQELPLQPQSAPVDWQDLPASLQTQRWFPKASDGSAPQLAFAGTLCAAPSGFCGDPGELPDQADTAVYLVQFQDKLLYIPLQLAATPDFVDGADSPGYLQTVLRVLEVPFETGQTRSLGAEQSNSNAVVDQQYLVKTYRRLFPGWNPEILVGEALTRLGSQITPRTYGATYVQLDGQPYVTNLVSEFVPGATDAFGEFTSAVWDPIAPATQLGAVTATMHTELAQCFGSSQALSTAALAQRVRQELATTLSAVPQLAQQPWFSSFAREVEATLGALETAGATLPTQKIHGDYHLGQVLYAPARPQPWLVIDFEGEPLRPLAERMLPDVALRDVAGMLRSFAYAAAMHQANQTDRQQGTDARQVKLAADWEERARNSFLAGYAPQGLTALEKLVLEALEIEKTCYECRYEATFRPDWLPVPLSGLKRFATTSANPSPLRQIID